MNKAETLKAFENWNKDAITADQVDIVETILLLGGDTKANVKEYTGKTYETIRVNIYNPLLKATGRIDYSNSSKSYYKVNNGAELGAKVENEGKAIDTNKTIEKGANKTVTTSLIIDEDLHAELRIRAFREKRTMNQILNELIVEYLELQKKGVES